VTAINGNPKSLVRHGFQLHSTGTIHVITVDDGDGICMPKWVISVPHRCAGSTDFYAPPKDLTDDQKLDIAILDESGRSRTNLLTGRTGRTKLCTLYSSIRTSRQNSVPYNSVYLLTQSPRNPCSLVSCPRSLSLFSSHKTSQQAQRCLCLPLNPAAHQA
jgi:hypothetical protein